ncbi:MAG: methylated-DNA-protein-cysteine methyltransferase related protein [Candidatus Cloacimonadota bacterium]|jgi:methylated-DNA-protein-cysteine methyltransferase-like protein|nr:methylated-DNA-protein-cysteine methyltransferase related protein [Candidatus Cloacimonadota bacterium]
MSGSSYQKIYEVVKQIPQGKVATYGQVAEIAGLAGQARLVGYALHALNQDNVPWQRVVNRNGGISLQKDRREKSLQQVMLEAEGIEFLQLGKLELSKYQWQPF